MFCLGSHYRKALVFTYENLDNAVIAYNKLIQKIASVEDEGELDTAVFDSLKAEFKAALDNDVNTSLAITALYSVLKSKTNGHTKLALIADFDRVLALDLIKAAEKAKKEAEKEASQAQSNEVAELSDDPFIRQIQEKIALRAAAKKAKNYAEADAIRNELEREGVILTDTAKGTTFTIKQ